MASYDVSTNPMAVDGEKMKSVQNRRRTQVEEWWHSTAGEAEQLRVVNKWSAGVQPNVLQQTLQVNSRAAAESVGGEGGGGKEYTEEYEEKRYGYKDAAIHVLCRSHMHVWGTQGQHIGWRNHKEWLQRCADADIPGAPETTFRRWKQKEKSTFEDDKDTPDFVPVRHKSHVAGLLAQVHLDREFAKSTVVEKAPSLQKTGGGAPFQILPTWYDTLKERCLQVIKLPGFGGDMVACFAAQLHGEKMNLSDDEAMMYTPSLEWAYWFMRVQMNLRLRKVCGAPVSPEARVKQDKLHEISFQRLAVRIAVCCSVLQCFTVCCSVFQCVVSLCKRRVYDFQGPGRCRKLRNCQHCCAFL